MKKFLKSFLAAAVAVIALAFAACGSKYEVSLGIGDGSKENDAVRVNYTLDDKIENGYELKCKVSAEKAADLNRDFVFAIAASDPIFSSGNYSETVLFTVKGSELAAKKKDDGSFGDLQISVKFEDLSKYFEQTESEKEFHFVLHEEGAEWSATTWNESAYTYTFDGTKVKITK